jgi:hypothetical protein
MSGVVAPGIVEQLVALRRRAPPSLWKEVCRVLSAASDEQTVDELLGKLHPSVNPDVYSALRSLLYACRREASWQSLGFALELAGQVVEQQDSANQIELIWTGPPLCTCAGSSRSYTTSSTRPRAEFSW